MDSNAKDECARIETARLVLRRPCMTDAAAVAALANDWLVASNLATMPHPYRIADAREWIERIEDRACERAFVILCSRSGVVMGACAIAETPWTDGRQIGYWLGRRFWGHGFATEAARAMVDLAFADDALHHLWCSCRVTNDRSRQVIHKCGFQFHSADMMRMLATGAAVPIEHYCLDRPVWLALHRWKAA